MESIYIIMGLSKIVGHSKEIEYLSKAMDNGRMLHGYLFVGPEGIGKRLLSFEVSKAIFCKSNEEKGCGKCSACHKFESMNHPDFMLIEPDGNSIKNKQIEDFQSFIKIKPNESDKKIIIIDDADKMTTSAQNRILKILEEPPSYGMIFLISSKEYGILPTIKSRCQTIEFSKVEDSQIEAFLQETRGVSPERSKLISKFSDGSFKVALSILESEKFQDFRQKVVMLSDVLIKGNLVKLYDLLGELGDQREDISIVLDLLRIWYRDLMFLKSFKDKDMVFNLDYLDELSEQSRETDYIKVSKYIDLIEDAVRKIHSNVNCGLVLEACLLNIQEV